MSADDPQIALVLRYFTAVDGEDLPALLDTLNEDCVFRVETHGVELHGKEQISDMFRRLWKAHASVLHDRFFHISDPEAGRIASQFQVTNLLHDGATVRKSNCNFFTLKSGRFSAISVYMAGENTLKG